MDKGSVVEQGLETISAQKREIPGKTGEALKKFTPALEKRVADDKLNEDVWYGKNTWELVIGGEIKAPEDEIYGLPYKEHQENILKHNSEGEDNQAGVSLFKALQSIDAEIGANVRVADNQGYENGWLFRDISQIVESAKYFTESRSSVEFVRNELTGILGKIKAGRFADEKLQELGPEAEIESALTMVVGLMSGKKEVVEGGIEEHKKWEEAQGRKENNDVNSEEEIQASNARLQPELQKEEVDETWEEFDRRIQEELGGEENWEILQGKLDMFVNSGVVIVNTDETGKTSYVINDVDKFKRIMNGGMTYFQDKYADVSEKEQTDYFVTMAALRHIENGLSEEQKAELRNAFADKATTINIDPNMDGDSIEAQGVVENNVEKSSKEDKNAEGEDRRERIEHGVETPVLKVGVVRDKNGEKVIVLRENENGKDEAAKELKAQRLSEIIHELVTEWEKSHGPMMRLKTKEELKRDKQLAAGGLGEEGDPLIPIFTESGGDFYFDHRGTGDLSVPRQAAKILAERYPEYATTEVDSSAGENANKPIDLVTANSGVVENIGGDPIDDVDAKTVPGVRVDGEKVDGSSVESGANVEESEEEKVKKNQRELLVEFTYLDLWKRLIAKMTEEQKLNLGISEAKISVLENEIGFNENRITSLAERSVLVTKPDDVEVMATLVQKELELRKTLETNPELARDELDKLTSEYEALHNLDVAVENVFLMGLFGESVIESQLRKAVGQPVYDELLAQVEGKYGNADVSIIKNEYSELLKRIVAAGGQNTPENLKDKITYSLLEKQLVKKWQGQGIGADLGVPATTEEGVKRSQICANKYYSSEKPSAVDIVEKQILSEWAVNISDDQRTLYHRELEKVVIATQQAAEGFSNQAKNPEIIKERIFDADAMAHEMTKKMAVTPEAISQAVEFVRQENAPNLETVRKDAIEIMKLEQQAAMGNPKARSELAAKIKDVSKYVAIGGGGVAVTGGIVYGLGWWLLFPLFFDAAIEGLKAGMNEQGIKV